MSSAALVGCSSDVDDTPIETDDNQVSQVQEPLRTVASVPASVGTWNMDNCGVSDTSGRNITRLR
jgi:hypothetical protein